MSAPIRWGILGAGTMAARFARDLVHGSGGQVSAIASRDQNRAMRLVAALGRTGQDARAFDDYAALTQNADVDAIYIATPTSCHREHALLAITAGKAVLCEKPIAASVADAQAIAHAARSAGVFCMEAVWTRFLPTVQEVERRLGDIGPLRRIDATLGFPRVQRDGDPITDSQLGGGALSDLGVYPLTIAMALVGEMHLVSGWARHSDAPNRTIRDAAALLEAQNGTIAINIGVSHSTHLSNRFEIAGANGRLVIDPPFIEALGLRHSSVGPMDHRSGDNQGRLIGAMKRSFIWPTVRNLRRQAVNPDGARHSADYRGTGLQFQAQEVARCLGLGMAESPMMPLDLSLGVQVLLQQIGNGSVRQQ